MTGRIDIFTGKYRFLSNFWFSEVILDGERAATVEHAFQAAKTTDTMARRRILTAPSPGIAKRLGREAPLRAGWNDMKIGVMRALLRQKFSAHFLRQLLIDTGDAELIEGNTWNDTFWGVCNGVGENHLGKLLMEVRAECRT